MATAFILAGSVMGFMLGVIGYLAFGVPLMLAVSMWIGAGPVSALIAVMATLLRRPAPRAALARI